VSSTVARCFDAFVKSVELSPHERELARRLEQKVFEALRQRLRPREAILSGSYGRGTVIRPLHDIDLFLVFAAGDADRRSPGSPRRLLNELEQTLREAFPGTGIRVQNRSVNILFKAEGIGIDVVPAFEDTGRTEVYGIPGFQRDEWILSNPRRHKEACDEANRQAKGRLIPLVKALKWWNRSRGKPLSSFWLETLTYEGVRSFEEKGGLCVHAQVAAHLFSFMSEQVLKDWPEPARLGPPVNAGADSVRRLKARDHLLDGARKAQVALEAERKGNHRTANEYWRELFGEGFPLEVHAHG